MKQKLQILAMPVLVAALLCGCCLSHEWQDATCEAPKTCAKCGETEGEALGHSWEAATCEAPETCSVCGKTQGAALGHTWTDATCETPKTCSVCQATEGEAPGHDLLVTRLTETTCGGICRTCGAEAEETVTDMEAFANAIIPGTWQEKIVYVDESEIYEVSKNIPIIFAEDGSGDALIEAPVKFQWRYHGFENNSLCYAWSVDGENWTVDWVIAFAEEPPFPGVIEEGPCLGLIAPSGYAFCVKE